MNDRRTKGLRLFSWLVFCVCEVFSFWCAKMDVSQFSQNALRAIMMGIKHSNELFSGKEDYDFYDSFDGFRKVMKVESGRIKSLMSKILMHQGIKAKIDTLDIEEMFDALSEANDIILERVGIATDEASGLRKVEDPILVTAVSSRTDINTSWNKKGSGNKDTNSTFRLLTARNVLRPQLKFKDKVDNSRGPFVPIIKSKPNSIKPLAVILETTEYGEMFTHPYQCELDHFQPLEKHLTVGYLKTTSSIEDTPFTFVTTVDQLNELCTDLKSQNEFAVDLEHHSYRTFQGIVCLMQISTREKDYVIDALELRSELEILNEVFTDPKIVKVFHGAEKDIEWLQRDLGIYVVNMFDTGQASRLLNFAHFSLAFLLKHYCKVDANKHFQLADWRMRPLPDEMIRYAREDTHYLLYIYDSMKNELLKKGNAEKNLLKSVFQRSKVICERRYIKPPFNPDNYLELCKKSRKVFNSRQLYALKEFYAWRDRVARLEDESIGYVLPNHMLLQIAEVLPREMQGILACCNPIPTLVRQNLNELHTIILHAREQSLVKPIVQELRIQVDESRQHIDLENVLHCPHDFSHLRDTSSTDTAPTLVDLWSKYGSKIDEAVEVQFNIKLPIKEKPELAAFIVDNKTDCGINKWNLDKVMSLFESYNSPYNRFKLVNPSLNRFPQTNNVASQSSHVKEVKDHFMELLKMHGKKESDASQHDKSPSCSLPLVKVPSTDKTITIDDEPDKDEVAIEIEDKGKKPSELVDEDIKAIEIEDDVPLFKKMPSGRKRKRNANQIANKVAEPVKQKLKKTRIEIDEAHFQPFDYSKTDAAVFQGGSGGSKAAKKHFDPDSGIPHYRAGKGSKTNMKGKTKSLTYSSNKTKIFNKSKLQRPKR